MNDIQNYIFMAAMEQSGLWDVVSDIAQAKKVDRITALDYIKNEIDFIKSNENIFFIVSDELYNSSNSEVLDKNKLLEIKLEKLEFSNEGPLYYFSNSQEI